MSSEQIRCLKCCHLCLIKKMDTDNSDLLDRLVADNVITKGQFSTLGDINSSFERNCTLLQILYSRPRYCFRKFQQCLKNSGHEDIASLLKI